MLIRKKCIFSGILSDGRYNILAFQLHHFHVWIDIKVQIKFIFVKRQTNTLSFVKNTNLIASIQIKEDLWFFQIGMYLYSHLSSYRWRKLSLAERLCRLFPLLSFPLRTCKYWILHMDYWSCYNIKFVCDSAKIKL